MSAAVPHLVVPIGETPEPEDFLTSSELSQYLDLKTPKRRRDWLAGRWAAKRLLGGLLGRAPETVEIVSDADGAPHARAAGPAGWTLSISHSRDWAAAAADPTGRPLGIDVETVEPRDPALLPVAFRAEELPHAADPAAVTRLWTAKEAVLKLLGLGLSVDLREVRVAPPLALEGRALERYRSLGSPAIEFDSWPHGGSWVTIARAQGGTN